MAASTLSALGGGPPKYDLVGPTIDDDIRRLIGRYGAQTVKEAATRLTKAKRGRKKIPDLAELADVLVEDARAWLVGRDPFAERTGYAIAKAYADTHPGHDHASTMQRIERKLRHKKHGRRWNVLARAMKLSRDGYPYGSHLRALDELSRFDGHSVWRTIADRLRANVADYSAKWGEPADELTVKQIEEGAREALSSTTTLSGLLGRTLEGYSLND